MFNFADIINPFQGVYAYDWADEVGVTIQNRVVGHFRRTQNSMTEAYHAVSQSCQHMTDRVGQTINNVEEFVFRNKMTLFFIGCAVATAYFSPLLFFPAVIITVIVRVEISRHLQKAADYYLKDERNPYKVNPQYEKCVNTLELTFGIIAAVDAIALGTLFVAGFWPVALIPILGGIAAGSSATKFGKNIAALFECSTVD